MMVASQFLHKAEEARFAPGEVRSHRTDEPG
jgi:hypothetical protein